MLARLLALPLIGLVLLPLAASCATAAPAGPTSGTMTVDRSSLREHAPSSRSLVRVPPSPVVPSASWTPSPVPPPPAPEPAPEPRPPAVTHEPRSGRADASRARTRPTPAPSTSPSPAAPSAPTPTPGRDEARTDPSPSSTPAAATTQSAGGDAYGTSLLAGVNAERKAAGLAALAPSDCAQGLAQRWATTLAGRGELAHQDLSVVLADCAPASLAAENVAWTPGGAEDAVAAWMSSAGHRANILEPRFTHVGSATEPGADGVVFAVQVFLAR